MAKAVWRNIRTLCYYDEMVSCVWRRWIRIRCRYYSTDSLSGWIIGHICALWYAVKEYNHFWKEGCCGASSFWWKSRPGEDKGFLRIERKGTGGWLPWRMSPDRGDMGNSLWKTPIVFSAEGNSMEEDLNIRSGNWSWAVWTEPHSGQGRLPFLSQSLGRWAKTFPNFVFWRMVTPAAVLNSVLPEGGGIYGEFGRRAYKDAAAKTAHLYEEKVTWLPGIRVEVTLIDVMVSNDDGAVCIARSRSGESVRGINGEVRRRPQTAWIGPLKQTATIKRGRKRDGIGKPNREAFSWIWRLWFRLAWRGAPSRCLSRSSPGGYSFRRIHAVFRVWPVFHR